MTPWTVNVGHGLTGILTILSAVALLVACRTHPPSPPQCRGALEPINAPLPASTQEEAPSRSPRR